MALVHRRLRVGLAAGSGEDRFNFSVILLRGSSFPPKGVYENFDSLVPLRFAVSQIQQARDPRFRLRFLLLIDGVVYGSDGNIGFGDWLGIFYGNIVVQDVSPENVEEANGAVIAGFCDQ